ncbi:uncharacterized protein PHALS_09756 [Plasmopara halstedii]|uniref:Uncharacterized protein n=1 Tax=Plasmopara halstedii TaxID=4781 RepID=A0A0P1AGC9_PLAHL|nr:uncharacterized protein PHALS_09756 [Plasmopara halstedii]CEG39514.1 hypothetical protein PHALS_09756 [Plasmopara halstedii]|eukprot:XP_024575883.1 hypothetical protein PHALS_09756 [Plasmopara halstedii]
MPPVRPIGCIAHSDLRDVLSAFYQIATPDQKVARLYGIYCLKHISFFTSSDS